MVEASSTQKPKPLGIECIREEARLADDAPGVYRMIGQDSEVLYVGKAKSLKKRILQYAQGRFHSNRYRPHGRLDA